MAKTSMSKKIRGMVGRARVGASRGEYSLADLVRWLGSSETKVRSLIGTLNAREGLGVTYRGKTVVLAEQSMVGAL